MRAVSVLRVVSCESYERNKVDRASCVVGVASAERRMSALHYESREG